MPQKTGYLKGIVLRTTQFDLQTRFPVIRGLRQQCLGCPQLRPQGADPVLMRKSTIGVFRVHSALLLDSGFCSSTLCPLPSCHLLFFPLLLLFPQSFLFLSFKIFPILVMALGVLDFYASRCPRGRLCCHVPELMARSSFLYRAILLPRPANGKAWQSF